MDKRWIRMAIIGLVGMAAAGILAAAAGLFQWFLLLLGVLLLTLAVAAAWAFSGGVYHLIRARNLKAHPFASNQGKVLMIGSSFLQFWATAEKDFAPLDVVNIGIAGTLIRHWTRYLSNTVVPYAPRALILYAGSNNFNDAKASAGQVFAELHELFDGISARLPHVTVVYLGICPTIGRKDAWEEIQRFHQLVRAACAERPHFHYVDSAPGILDASGALQPDLYLEDTIHFTEKGYQAWASQVCPAVRQILLP